MTTTIFRSFALPLAATLMATHSPAQNTDMKNEVVKYSYNKTADNTPFSNKDKNAIKTTATVPYNGKVFQEFQKKFSDATNVSWSLEHSGTYHAFFQKDENFNAILLDKKGQIIYLINYLSEEQLPPDVKNLIADNYDEYKIANVTKIQQNHRTTWIINLKGVNHLVQVAVEDGEIQQLDKYNLAN
jgi:hypothetical protein